MNDVSYAASTLSNAQTRLAQRWEATKAVWNDEVQRYFDGQFYAPLDDLTLALWREMDHLADVLAMIDRSVE